MTQERNSKTTRPPKVVYGPNVEMPVGTHEEQEAAWLQLQAVFRNPPEPGPDACPPGQYGSREEWYDDRSR